MQEFCDYGTKEECMKASDADRPCRKLHFRSFGRERDGVGLWEQSFLFSTLLPVIGVMPLTLLLNGFNMVCLRLPESEVHF